MDRIEKEKAFVEMYQKEADAIFRYTILRVANREEALDIVGDIFLRFWQTFVRQTEIKNVRAMLFTIARNRIIDWYRKKKSLSLEALTEGEDGESFDIKDPGVHEEILNNAEAQIVLRAVGDLRDEYREAVYLRYVEDLSPAEISHILGGTVNAISIRINRGLEELRKILRIEKTIE